MLSEPMAWGKKSLRLAGAWSVAAAILCGFASTGHAELIERGDLFVRFEGGLHPTALPRERLAPITIYVGGTIKTLSGKRPPALRRITIEVNQGGRLDSRGLPICRYRQIEATAPREAMRRCGGSLVGEGRFVATATFPEQTISSARGHTLAFNGIYRGQEVIFAHVFGLEPVPASRIFIFHIRRTRGTYGTVLTGEVPAKLNRHGYLKSISLRLNRRFRHRGGARSYLSAACPAPPGFFRAIFPFVRASMLFEDGRTLSSTVTRTCAVERQ